MRRLSPGMLSGSVKIPASKSQAHRLLILAALADTPTTLLFDGISDDITATIDCLNALGAEISRTENGAKIVPIRKVPTTQCRLPCRESGSTLRFLLPVCGLLGADAVFIREGRLKDRPLAPFDAELCAHGMCIRPENERLFVSGGLSAGEYTLPGNISSQYITGLLLALSHLKEKSTLTLSTKLESADYVQMTVQALEQFGYGAVQAPQSFAVGGETPQLHDTVFSVEADFSSAAFFLCAGALSEKGIFVKGLNLHSAQPDRAVLEILRQFGAEVTVQDNSVFVRKQQLRPISADCSAFPDLVPIVSVLCAFADGTSELKNLARLRLKESDRLTAAQELICALGGSAEINGDDLRIYGQKTLCGGSVRTYADHRMAMSAAIASTACTGSVCIDNDTCVAKSYPRFWEDFASLKGADL